MSRKITLSLAISNIWASLANSMKTRIEEFLETVHSLRDPKTGCPWDLKQTHESLASYCIEEAHEAVQAIEGGDPEEIMDELGDVLLQVVLHGQLLKESGRGSFDRIVEKINAKMVERHPHVFKKHDPSITAEKVLDNWNASKLKNSKSHTPVADKLQKLPASLPALHKALRYGDVLQGVGFDWASPAQVWEKVIEETGELKEAIQNKDTKNQMEELGDLLFVLAQWARKSGFDPEQSLREAVSKFSSRVRIMEELSTHDLGKDLCEVDLETQEKLWLKAKVKLKHL